MPAKGKRRQDKEGITIIRREEVVEGGSHGGAWKVAYADFVTALMAFFLLMWLLNATTEDQRKGLADYFSPTNLMSHNSSGTGQPFGGHTAFDSGALLSDRGSVQITQGNRPILTESEEDDQEIPVHAGQKSGQTDQQKTRENPKPARSDQARNGQRQDSQPQADQMKAPAPAQEDQLRPDAAVVKAAKQAANLAAQENQTLEQAAQEIRQAVSGDKALGDLTKHLSIDLTPQGLRIQILDSPNEPMFALGSAQPNELTRTLLGQIAPVLKKLPEPVAIDGHTDAAQYPGTTMTNWELSTNRANAARRLLVDNGLSEERIKEVTGHADRDLLLTSDPLAAANRRVAITVLRSLPAPASPPQKSDPAGSSPAMAPTGPGAPGPKMAIPPLGP